MVMRTDVHETRSKSSDGGWYVRAAVSFDVEILSRYEDFMAYNKLWPGIGWNTRVA